MCKWGWMSLWLATNLQIFFYQIITYWLDVLADVLVSLIAGVDCGITLSNTDPWIEHRESLAAVVPRCKTRPSVPMTKILLERSILLHRLSSTLIGGKTNINILSLWLFKRGCKKILILPSNRHFIVTLLNATYNGTTEKCVACSMQQDRPARTMVL